MHVLLLTDRDWTHPQGGGTGTNLYGQVSRWLEWGHRVTVIAGAYEDCEPVSRPTEGLEIHRMGSRLTVFARAALATRRGVGADADVVLEVVNGIAFFTPAWWWLKMPAVALVHHVHQDHYVTELGLMGRVAALLLERIPLAVLYRFRPVMTISHAARADMVALGVPDENIHVVYMGTEPSTAPEHPESETPNLLYLGRLKAYKRIENLLSALELVPAAQLEIAGDGDHREQLVAEIAERGLTERVTLHGFVSEAEKAELYDRAWVSLTASSAEGWCLTVMEAADRGTPSAALRVGGLPESIVDGETGVLCDTAEELATEVAALCADEPRRRRLGAAAEARARGFTWEHTARANLDVLEGAVSAGRRPLRSALTGSDTGKAAGLAGASLMNNAIQLAFTVAITRILGKADYSALAAIISAFLVLLVGGQSIQAAAAREVALGRLGDHHALLGTIRGWTRTLMMATVVAALVGALLREPLGALMGVPEHSWAAAAVLPTGVLWMLLSLQRGVLQGLHAYAPVGLSIIGEAFGRLAFGLGIALAAGGVTGVFLASPLAFLVTSAGLSLALTRRLGAAPAVEQGAPAAVRTLRTLMANGWVPIISLALLAILQNVDVIVARHELGDDRAGSYAVAAVAAKVVIWVAIGVGLQLLPQATARAAAGEDPRPVLFRALAVLAAVAAPSLLLFALFPTFILSTAFGPDTVDAAPALLLLTIAMTLLAVAYLTVQYMLALGSMSFLWVLGAVAAIEIPLLFNGSSITGFATLVLGAQVVVASAVLAIGLRARPRPAMMPAG